MNQHSDSQRFDFLVVITRVSTVGEEPEAPVLITLIGPSSKPRPHMLTEQQKLETKKEKKLKGEIYRVKFPPKSLMGAY